MFFSNFLTYFNLLLRNLLLNPNHSKFLVDQMFIIVPFFIYQS